MPFLYPAVRPEKVLEDWKKGRLPVSIKNGDIAKRNKNDPAEKGLASICASCFRDASARMQGRRMRVQSTGYTHAYWKAGCHVDVLAFGIAPHIIQGCTKCLAICTRDTLVRRCPCCCVAVAAVTRRRSLVPTCSGAMTRCLQPPSVPRDERNVSFE